MPDPNVVSPGASGTRIDMSGAPGSDISFDDLFPPSEGPAAPQAPQGTIPLQQPQAVDQPFLKAGSSIYNTAEEAARGLEHKDQLVARYRAFLSENGFDPNELKPVVKPQAAPEPQTPSPYKYYKSNKLFSSLSNALSNKDMAAYEQIQSEFAAEAAQDQIQQILAPYAPLLAETARQRAIRDVSKEIPDFVNFYGSANYKAVTDRIPLIREMEAIGESNPSAASRLPELYKMSYLISQGMNPQAPPAQVVPPVQNPPTARTQTTSLSPSSLTPPSQGVDTRSWAQSQGNGRQLNTDARKQLIKDFEGRGIDNADWSRLGT